MDFTAHVFVLGVLDDFVGIWRIFQVAVTSVLIGRDQFHFVADGIAHESRQRFGIGVFNHLADHVPFTTNRADNGNLASRASSGLLFIPMAIAVLSADIRFVNFDRAKQLSQAVIFHRSAYPHHHVPSRAVVTRSNLAMDLESADSFLALSHQVDHLKPNRKRIVRILENGFGDDAETVAVASATILILADPMPRLRRERIDFLALASRAFDAIRPAHIAQQRFARCLVAELFHQLRERDVWLSAKRLASFNFLVHEVNI